MWPPQSLTLFSGLATAMWSVLRKMHQGSWVDCSCHQAPVRLPGTQQLSRAGIDLSPTGAWSWAWVLSTVGVAGCQDTEAHRMRPEESCVHK